MWSNARIPLIYFFCSLHMAIRDDEFSLGEEGSDGTFNSLTQDDFEALLEPEIVEPNPMSLALEALYDTIIPPPEIPDIPFSKELWEDFYGENPGSFISMSLNSVLWDNVIDRVRRTRENLGQNHPLDSSKLQDLSRLHFAPVGKIYLSVNHGAEETGELVVRLVNGYFGLFKVNLTSHLLTPGNRMPLCIPPSAGAISLVQYAISTGTEAFKGLTKIVDEFDVIDMKLMGRIRQIKNDRDRYNEILRLRKLRNRQNFSQR